MRKEVNVLGILNKLKNKGQKTVIKMMTERGNGFYSWNGEVYQSDIIRACIHPKANAIGKLNAKHIRTTVNSQTGERKVEVNPEPYLRFLLEEPNPLMSGQKLQEKMANQLALNNNAFAVILRDENDFPQSIYPIPCLQVEAVYINQILYLKFLFHNGKQFTFPYHDVIHLRTDFVENDVFGESKAEMLRPLMEIVSTTDQGIIRAIRNSGVVQWLLKFTRSLKTEDIKKNAEEFANNYLSLENGNMGVAGVDAKADAQRVEPKDYVPNAAQMDRTMERFYSTLNTNKRIVQSSFNDVEWNSYFEAEVEPVVIDFQNEYTRKIFTRRERGFGNKIVFEAANLNCASIQTKLSLVSMVDRGALTPNEWREAFNLAPVAGGDEPIRRLDTQTVNKQDNLKGGDENEG